MRESTHGGAWILLTQLTLGTTLLLGGSAGCRAQDAKASDYQVKAAYLYNFAKLAEWPAQSSATGPSTFAICVVGGDSDFIGVLTGVVAGRVIAGRPVVVKRVSTREEMFTCQLLFFRSSERKRTQGTIGVLERSAILLVGEDSSFLQNGGMVNLILENGKIQFEVNRDALDRADIRFSPQTLALARAEYPRNQNGSSQPSEGSRQLRHSVSPEYPEIAQRMNLKGAVQVEVRVQPDGTVSEVKVIGGHPLLVDALSKAVMKWRYAPSSKETLEVVKYSFGQ